MDVNVLLWSFGVAITIVVGFVGIRTSRKYTRSVDLLFVQHEWIPLFETIVRDMKDVEVKFKQQPISENIILFNGSFVNNGNSDIDESMVHKRLSICLPKEFRWLEAKITKHSKGVNASCEIAKGNELHFDWDLLKKNEFLTFSSLIELQRSGEKKDDEESLFDLFEINFEHRITNLSKVKKEHLDLGESEKESKFERYVGIVLPLVIVIPGLFLAFFASRFGEIYSIKYYLLENNKKIEIELTAKSEKCMFLKQKGTEEEIEVSPEDLLKKYKLEPYIKRESFGIYSLLILGLIMCVLGIWMFIDLIFFDRTKKLKKFFINIKSQNTDTSPDL